MAYSRQTDAAGDLLDERRRLLEYVLEVGRGFRLAAAGTGLTLQPPVAA